MIGSVFSSFRPTSRAWSVRLAGCWSSGSHRRSDARGRPQLWRVSCHDAARRRAVRLSSRSLWPPLGFSLWMDPFLVIQTGTIAAVSVAFARFLGILAPIISPTQWVIPPINFSTNYAASLSTQQLVAILVIVFLTILNTRGLRLGKLIQNVFTSAKTVVAPRPYRPWHFCGPQRRRAIAATSLIGGRR